MGARSYRATLEALARLRNTDFNLIANAPESADHVAREIESLVGRAVLARNDPEASKRLLIDVLSELIAPNTSKRHLCSPRMGELNQQPRPKPHQGEGPALEV